MSIVLKKYITALDYADNILFVSWGASSGVSICLFTIVIGAHVRILGTSISLVFLVCKKFLKTSLKTMRKLKKNKEKLFYWPGVNLIALKK